ncbi:MAG TPA: sodium-dependent transporter [Cyclobacteriaceae bacterium]
MAARGLFTNRIGFVLAAAGSAVGLGNIVKFPFEVGQGGGAAFLVMYLIFCFVLCFPVMVTEVAIGRKTELNPVGAFNALGFKKWNILGKLGIISGILILSFYNIVAGWGFGYVVELLLGNFDINFSNFTKDIFKVGLYAIIFMLLTANIVSKGVSAGIEKAAKILMPTLIIIILGLVVYALTLPHALEGIKFYLIPDLTKFNLSTISGALRQAFFSLSLGMGALITYGSYLDKKENIVSSATMITFMDVGIAFISGLMMFPLVAYNNAGDMSNISGGLGLIFVTLPSVFETLGATLGALIGGLFFLLLSFAALTSTVSLLEVPVAYIVDQYHILRKRAVIVAAAIIFLLGIPSLLANGYSDFFSNAFPVPGSTDFMSLIVKITDSFLLIGGCLIVIFGAYVWKKTNLHNEISNGIEHYNVSFVKSFLNITLSYVCPILLALLFLVVLLNNFFGVSI